MKDSTKKRLIITGLAAVCVLLIFGISRVLYKEPVQELPEESKTTEEMEPRWPCRFPAPDLRRTPVPARWTTEGQ